MFEINLTNQNFEKEVINSEKPVLVDFFATWCGPCMMISPIISEIAEEHKDNIKVCKVNVDEQQELANKYEIFNIPTIMLFKNGEIAKKSEGYLSKSELEEMIGI